MTLIEKIKKLVWYNSPSKLKEILLEISGSTFNPSEHDLDEFTNTSTNPYVRQDEIGNGGGDFIPQIEVTKSQINTLISNSELIEGVTYKITGIQPFLYGGWLPFKRPISKISLKLLSAFSTPKSPNLSLVIRYTVPKATDLSKAPPMPTLIMIS